MYPSCIYSNHFQYSYHCNILQRLTKAKPSAVDSLDSKAKRSNLLVNKGRIPTKNCEMSFCKKNLPKWFQYYLFYMNYIEYNDQLYFNFVTILDII